MPKNHEAILRDFIDRVWNKKEFGSVPEFVNPEYTVHLDAGDPWEGGTLNHEEFITRLRYSFDSFPDIHFAIQTAVSGENHVAITWILTGTNLGNIEKFPPTNKSIKTFGSTIYCFKDGLVCGHYQVFDRTTVARQLGYLKP